MEKTYEHRGLMKMRMRRSQNSEQNPSANSTFNKLLIDEQSPHPRKNLSLMWLTKDEANPRTDIFAKLPLWPILSRKSKVAFIKKTKGKITVINTINLPQSLWLAFQEHLT